MNESKKCFKALRNKRKQLSNNELIAYFFRQNVQCAGRHGTRAGLCALAGYTGQVLRGRFAFDKKCIYMKSVQAAKNERFTMPGSKTNDLTRAQVLAAVRAIPPGQDYVWDGLDEDDRPASDAELQAGLQAALKKRGRPTGSGSKEQVAIRIDRDVLAAFRAGGAGWQTRMNDALRDWLRSHSAV
jgi:uncharacterized protein (DUF4415 family)